MSTTLKYLRICSKHVNIFNTCHGNQNQTITGVAYIKLLKIPNIASVTLIL